MSDIPPELLAKAEEINALCDNGGLEQSALESLVRAVLFIDRQKRGSFVTPEVLEAFGLLFRKWQMEDWNQERLEAGGTGDLSTLAPLCLEWALAV